MITGIIIHIISHIITIAIFIIVSVVGQGELSEDSQSPIATTVVRSVFSLGRFEK